MPIEAVYGSNPILLFSFRTKERSLGTKEIDIDSLADDRTEVTQAIPAGTPSLIAEVLIKMDIIDHRIDQEDRFVGGKRPRK